jgi:hypothetical protein
MTTHPQRRFRYIVRTFTKHNQTYQVIFFVFMDTAQISLSPEGNSSSESVEGIGDLDRVVGE